MPSTSLARPKSRHRCTEDRLGEGSAQPPSFFMSRKIAKNRKSVFTELGLDTDDPGGGPHWSEQAFNKLTGLASPTNIHAAPDEPDNGNAGAHGSRSCRTEAETHQGQHQQRQEGQDTQAELPQSPTSQLAAPTRWYSRLTARAHCRPRIRAVSSAPQPPSLSTVARLSAIALLIAVLLLGFSYYKGRDDVSPNGGADASVMMHAAAGASSGPALELGGKDAPRQSARDGLIIIQADARDTDNLWCSTTSKGVDGLED